MENVVLRNIHIAYKGGGTKAQAQREIPKASTTYPKIGMFGDLPAYGFFIRHVNEISQRNVQLEVLAKDFRFAIVCDDVEELTLTNSSFMGDSEIAD